MDSDNKQKMTYTEAKEICERFSLKHKVIFEEEGECGFGRECVGFSSGDNWIDHNPRDRTTHEPIADLACEATWAPPGVNAYHKHACLAVLGRGEAAVIQLAEWVRSMESAGEVEVVRFLTGATGIQAAISGLTGRAVVVR
jgi:hypothetical protein